MEKKFMIVGVAGLVAFIAIVLILNANIDTSEEDTVVIFFPTGKDFPNPDQGKITLEFSFPETVFKVGDKTADLLMLLNSDTVPGLKISYNQKENTLNAGIPSLIVGNVILLDGKKHKIEYLFNRIEKFQSVAFDDTLLASGEFSGSITTITGYAISDAWEYVDTSQPIKVSFE